MFLPSGGSLIIDRTEAMTVIDVNTGKFTGTGGNLESTVTSNNLEAAEELVAPATTSRHRRHHRDRLHRHGAAEPTGSCCCGGSSSAWDGTERGTRSPRSPASVWCR